MRHVCGLLWSLWSWGGHDVHQHVVAQAPRGALLPPLLTSGRRTIRFTDAALASVFRARGAFPQFHPCSRSHYYFFSNSAYADVMEYADYCATEDKLAHIVENYLQDQKNNWLIVLDDPLLVDGIRGYLAPSYAVDRTTWVSTTPTPYSGFVMVDTDSAGRM